MNIEDYRLYFNYRIILKTASKQKGLAGDSFENNDFYAIFKAEVENEINLLYKFKIKPVKTSRLINYYGKKSLSPALPQFLHIYDKADVFDAGGSLESKIRSADGIFLTSSRFEGAKIYKPGADIFNNLDLYLSNAAGKPKFDFICVGTNSEAEIEFIKKFSGNPLLIILPSNPLPDLTALNKTTPNFLHISAIDPFSKNSKYGFALRNSLAFHLSQEMIVLYLSEKSSLSSIIKKFENAGKPVNIFEREYSKYTMAPDKKPDISNTGIKKEYNSIQKFIINSLEKENITIDNLLKLSNIKLNVDEKEIIKAISILEMNSEIERRPGGIIKKI
jgi:hypothetical protein